MIKKEKWDKVTLPRTLFDDIQSCDSVGFCHGGEVKDVFDKTVDLDLGQESHLPNMHQLSCAFAHDMDSEQFLTLRIGNEF